MVACLAELDCLASLAHVSSSSDEGMVRPEFIPLEDNKGEPYIEL